TTLVEALTATLRLTSYVLPGSSPAISCLSRRLVPEGNQLLLVAKVMTRPPSAARSTLPSLAGARSAAAGFAATAVSFARGVAGASSLLARAGASAALAGFPAVVAVAGADGCAGCLALPSLVGALGASAGLAATAVSCSAGLAGDEGSAWVGGAGVDLGATARAWASAFARSAGGSAAPAVRPALATGARPAELAARSACVAVRSGWLAVAEFDGVACATRAPFSGVPSQSSPAVS